MATEPTINLPALPMIPCPIWAKAERIGEVFGLAPGQLARLADSGAIRRRKLGDTRQAHTLYSCLDVMEWLNGSDPYPS